MRRLLARVIPCGLVVLALLLAGCTDDRVRPSDTLPPTSSPTPTPEDLPGPDGYPLPPEAQEYTAAGAAAFVYYFFDVLSATALTLDSGPLRELSRDCDTCSRIADAYDQESAAGYVSSGGASTVSGLGPPLLVSELGVDVAEFSIQVERAASQRLDASGQVVAEYPDSQSRGGIQVSWLPDTKEWLVTALTLEAT